VFEIIDVENQHRYPSVSRLASLYDLPGEFEDVSSVFQARQFIFCREFFEMTNLFLNRGIDDGSKNRTTSVCNASDGNGQILYNC